MTNQLIHLLELSVGVGGFYDWFEVVKLIK